MGEVEDGRRFEVGRCIGSGGFGEVYRATMVSSGGVVSEVAIKVLHLGLDPRSQAVQRLADEAKLLGLLRHPSILRIHDLVLLDSRIALVTEFVDGADLDQCTHDPGDPMPLRALLQAIAHVAAALHTAYHALGPDGQPLHLLHRDIKPSNIRVGRHGEVKLLDFGIAKAAGERIAQTQTNALIGSFAYMSPERLDRAQEDDAAGDVFSLGATLAEALSGARLFDGSIKDIYRISMDEERLNDHVEAHLARIAEHAEVAGLIREMLAYDPRQRPSLDTVSERLEDVADEISGPTLSRWCRKHSWHDGAIFEGELSGRMITESRISAEHLGKHVPTPKEPETSGSLSDRTFQYEVGAETIEDAVPGIPAAATFSDVDSFAPEADPPAAVEAPPSPEPDFVEEPPPPTGDGGLRTMGTIAVAAVLLLLLATVGTVGGGAAMLGGMVWLGGEPEEPPTDKPVEAPVQAPDDPTPEVPVPMPVAPVPDPELDPEDPGDPDTPDGPIDPDPDDGGVDGDPDAVDPSSIARCGDPGALEVQSMAGRLGKAAACIEGLLDDDRMAQTDRGKLGKILIHDARVRCEASGACGDYERVQRRYFEEVTRSEAELLYGFSAHLAAGAANDAQRADALAWTQRALELKGQWKGLRHIERVDALLERAARLTYATFSGNPGDARARVAARNAAVAWMNQRIDTGRDHAPALALCASAEGSEDACLNRGNDVGAQFAITFVSRPLGAKVFVDGEQVGSAPLTVQLGTGAHDVKMVGSDTETTQRIEVDLEQPTRFTWTASDGSWASAM